MITQAESIAHLCGAAAVATALLAVGLAGRRTNVGGRMRRRPRRVWVALGVAAALATLYVADAERSGIGEGLGAVAVLSLVALAGLGLAAVLLRVGLRGRRVGDHEYCRRCGFDLFGRPACTAVCNECGAPLDAARATVVGVRQRRPVPLVLGGFALLLSLALATAGVRPAIVWARAHNWQQFRPERSLVADLNSGVPARELAAATGLAWKDDRGALSPVGRAALINWNLARGEQPRYQALGWSPWPILQSVRQWRDGTLDEATVRRAMRLSLDLGIRLGAAAEQGGPLRFHAISPKRDSADEIVIRCERRADALGGVPLGKPFASPYRLDDDVATTADALAAFGDALPVPATQPVGPATLATTMTVTATLALPGRPTLVERRDVTLSALTSIVPPGGLRCPPILDARGGLAMPVEPPLVRLDPPGPATGWSLVVIGAGDGDWLGDLVCRTPDGAERRLATRCVGQGWQVVVPIDGRLPTPCEIVFRPRPELGAQRFSVGPTFQRELAVPLEAPPNP